MIRKQYAIISVLIFILLGCATKEKSAHPIKGRIIAELSSKAHQIDSYAQDYRINGRFIKRMYFQFKRNGRPFYRFREDLVRSGKRFIYIYNADGKHDYHYFPDEKKAYQCPTSRAWNESNYAKAKDWHFDYQGGRIIGEDVFSGKGCYLLELRNSIYAIWKEKGIKLAKMNDLKNKNQAMVYENMVFDLSDDVFQIPADVKVIEQEKCNWK